MKRIAEKRLLPLTFNKKSRNTIDLRPHRKLDVWKKAMTLTKEIYNANMHFSKSEEYGLTSQMRRAVVSVPSNLAEGAARKGSKEFKQFINIAQGSLSELDTQLELALMIHYLRPQNHRELMAEVTSISRMVYGLSKAVRNDK